MDGLINYIRILAEVSRQKRSLSKKKRPAHNRTRRLPYITLYENLATAAQHNERQSSQPGKQSICAWLGNDRVGGKIIA